jgi:hypothetical protein
VDDTSEWLRLKRRNHVRVRCNVLPLTNEAQISMACMKIQRGDGTTGEQMDYVMKSWIKHTLPCLQNLVYIGKVLLIVEIVSHLLIIHVTPGVQFHSSANFKL